MDRDEQELDVPAGVFHASVAASFQIAVAIWTCCRLDFAANFTEILSWCSNQEQFAAKFAAKFEHVVILIG
jgi:hypothetical protein